MADTMRGVYTNLTEIRRNVFSNVAKIAYDMKEDDEKTTRRKIRDLPYEIIPGDVATYRESVFLERAIVEQRIRLAMGLPLQGVDKRESLTDGLADASVPETYYEPPLVNVIKFACNACEDNVYRVTDGSYYEPPLINVIKFACNACDDNVYRVTNACQSCLAHPCREICPKGAISFKDKKAYIDQEKCIHCGMCFNTCPYHAIQHQVRPCADACGMHAIGSDEHGRAQIDYEKCVSCGQCLINCPFGAIADKSQIFQVIQAINCGDEVIAEVAPAFVGQFGGKGNVDKLRQAFTMLGFSGMEEVAVGADLCTVQEAEDFMAHRAPAAPAAPQRQDRLRRALLGQEARGHAQVRSLRGRLRPHLRGDGRHDEGARHRRVHQAHGRG